MLSAKRIIVVLVVVAGSLVTLPVRAQEIPALTDLSGSAGPGPDEVTLFWSTPMFELPLERGASAGREIEYGDYDFRYSDTEITVTNWDSAVHIPGEMPPIGVGSVVELELDVMYYWWGGVIIYYDQLHLRAFLTARLTHKFFAPLYKSFRNQPIKFTVRRLSDGVIMDQATAYTSYLTGVAEYVPTIDLTNMAYPGEMMEVTASWAGGSIETMFGVVTVGPARDDVKQRMVHEGTNAVPAAGYWGMSGGVHSRTLDDTHFQFVVPAGAVDEEEVEVWLYTPGYVPPPVGMEAGVPGAMTAFQLEKADGPLLNIPVLISMQYPDYLLAEFGGLGETSLRPYRYDDLAEQWELLELSPVVLDREEHTISFRTDRLGLFAIAAETDADGDTLGDVQELECGTDPEEADTDGDGEADGDEFWLYGGDPTDPWKVDGDDQYAFGQGLDLSQGQYIAARLVVDGEESDLSNCIYIPPTTVWAGLSCVPSSGNLPFSAQFTATMTNLYWGQIRRLAGHIDVTLANGTWAPNWRAGFTNVGSGSSFITSWPQNIPALGSVVGDNTFQLVAEDVTPSPFNQPPYPPAGDTSTSTCTVTGVAP